MELLQANELFKKDIKIAGIDKFNIAPSQFFPHLEGEIVFDGCEHISSSGLKVVQRLYIIRENSTRNAIGIIAYGRKPCELIHLGSV